MTEQKPNHEIFPKKRIAWVIAAVALIWGVIIAKLYYLQVDQYQYYLGEVIKNVQSTTTVKGERGSIYDCNGVTLATNYTVYRVFISPNDMLKNYGTEEVKVSALDKDMVELVASGLSDLLDVDKEKILELCQKTSRKDETVKKNVEPETAEKLLGFIAENDLDAQIHLEANSKRFYPGGTLAAQVIGVVGTDSGLIGLEKQYDSYLAGSTIKFLTAKNSQGSNMPFKYDTYLKTASGNDLHTTIDENIQRILEAQLKATYEDSSPLNRVTGIAMEPSTGAIRGMAVWPPFDLNDPYTLTEELQALLGSCEYEPGTEEYQKYQSELLYSMWRNKAVSEIYEPGSTFKIVTTSVSLEERVATTGTHFNCTGEYFVEGYTKPIHCHKLKGHGDLTFGGALQQSCNPSMMTLSALLGKKTFYDYFREFGYTEKTGVDLPGEASAVYHAFEDFNQVELAVYSFGQTFKITPIRQITSICAVANGGYLVTPYIVDHITDRDGSTIYAHEGSVRRQVISTDVCRQIAAILEEGVSGDGGAKNAYVAGYKIAAKTGTSEVRDKINPLTGEADYRVGSTVAYAPSDDPKIAVIIIVDEPQCDNTAGSMVAAPYIANFMNEVLPYLGIEREYSAEELEKLEITARDYSGWTTEEAKKDIERLGITCEIIGKGPTVSAQLPSPSSSFTKEGGKVVLYTGEEKPQGEIKVPNVTGMTLVNANKLLTSLGLNITVKGSDNGSAGATVTMQNLPEGTLVPKGSLITLTLRYLDGTAN